MTDSHDEERITLPEPVRDHLGQQLRGVYTVESEPPRYLGDEEPAVPEHLAPQLQKLETRLKTHEEGTEAVEQALDRILDAFGVAQAAPGRQEDAAPGRAEDPA